jgi:hypothetical protein
VLFAGALPPVLAGAFDGPADGVGGVVAVFPAGGAPGVWRVGGVGGVWPGVGAGAEGPASRPVGVGGGVGSRGGGAFTAGGANVPGSFGAASPGCGRSLAGTRALAGWAVCPRSALVALRGSAVEEAAAFAGFCCACCVMRCSPIFASAGGAKITGRFCSSDFRAS